MQRERVPDLLHAAGLSARLHHRQPRGRGRVVRRPACPSLLVRVQEGGGLYPVSAAAVVALRAHSREEGSPPGCPQGPVLSRGWAHWACGDRMIAGQSRTPLTLFREVSSLALGLCSEILILCRKPPCPHLFLFSLLLVVILRTLPLNQHLAPRHPGLQTPGQHSRKELPEPSEALLGESFAEWVCFAFKRSGSTSAVSGQHPCPRAGARCLRGMSLSACRGGSVLRGGLFVDTSC